MTKVQETLARRWQDVVNLVFGLWLIVSPWVLNYATLGQAAWNAYVMGALVAVVSIAALAIFREWEEWVSMVFGIWLVVAPWVLGFSTALMATWNHVVVGVMIAALALCALAIRYYSGRTRAA